MLGHFPVVPGKETQDINLNMDMETGHVQEVYTWDMDLWIWICTWQFEKRHGQRLLGPDSDMENWT